jgi:hypothetical protein
MSSRTILAKWHRAILLDTDTKETVMEPRLCNRMRVLCYRLVSTGVYEWLMLYAQDYLEAATRFPDSWSLDAPGGGRSNDCGQPPA